VAILPQKVRLLNLVKNKQRLEEYQGKLRAWFLPAGSGHTFGFNRFYCCFCVHGFRRELLYSLPTPTDLFPFIFCRKSSILLLRNINNGKHANCV